ncbi:MAG: DUF4268 domain-containing protein [Clostridiales bacterium]|nr:DUF4268 domain-containing protein [Clostridiales bacterium]
MTTKADSVSKNLRREFWEKALPVVGEKVTAFKGRSASTDHWIMGASGHGGIGFNLRILKDRASIELYIDTGEQEKNKRIFDILFEQKAELETAYEHH